MEETNSLILQLKDIGYQINKQPLLDHIDFSLFRGKITGLLGVNGAGKSTTLKIIAGILTPNTGEIHRRNILSIGYAPELPPLIPGWTVQALLQHACDLQNIPQNKQSESVNRIAELLNLTSILNKKCQTLSKGNQQRVNLAQALLHQPDLLILDEPTSGLDPEQISHFRQLLLKLKPNTAIIMSSHIMQEITATCDHAIVIHEGRQAGEISLSERRNRFIIEFEQNVSASTFAQLPMWHSSKGSHHEFISNPIETTNTALRFCLEKHLPISRVVGIEDFVEQEFLSLIGHAHA